METFEQARQTVLAEITSDDVEVRDKYLERFYPEVEKFSDAMAQAFLNWRCLDDEVKGNERRAHISGLVFTAITLHILSLKHFVGIVRGN